MDILSLTKPPSCEGSTLPQQASNLAVRCKWWEWHSIVQTSLGPPQTRKCKITCLHKSVQSKRSTQTWTTPAKWDVVPSPECPANSKYHPSRARMFKMHHRVHQELHKVSLLLPREMRQQSPLDYLWSPNLRTLIRHLLRINKRRKQKN